MAQKLARRSAPVVEHGQNIFIYGHVRTRQVVYSLTRTLDNNSALKQLPFLGKKTVPPVLRKDFWQPLATVFFPSGHQGLSAYRQLREFRKRHELEWDLSAIRTMPRKKRGRYLQDQKANSIADLAVILEEQAKIAEVDTALNAEDSTQKEQILAKAQQKAEELKRLKAETRKAYLAAPGSTSQTTAYKQHKNALMKLKKWTATPATPTTLTRISEVLNDTPRPLNKRVDEQREKEVANRLSMKGIRIEWANILDAEFAKKWPESVVHDRLARGGNRQRHTSASSLEPKPEPTVEELAAKRERKAREVKEAEEARKARSLGEVAAQEPEPSAMKRIVDRLRFGKQR